MTTIREHLEQGTLKGAILSFYKMYKGNTPLCCYENRLVNGEWLITCTWLHELMIFEDFRKKCLECQEEIERRLNAKD